MILVDTSVWSRHFRVHDADLDALLADGRVVMHTWVVGELALGPGLRLEIIDDLAALRAVEVVSDEALLEFVRLHRLRGVGWVDAQLLFSALRAGAQIWTLDASLAGVAARFQVGWSPAG